MEKQQEFRCTRSDLYAHECLGKNNVSARQGHYVTASSKDEALAEMKRRFKNEANFTVHTLEEAEEEVDRQAEARKRGQQ